MSIWSIYLIPCFICLIIGAVLGCFIGVLGTIFCTDMLSEKHKKMLLKRLNK